MERLRPGRAEHDMGHTGPNRLRFCNRRTKTDQLKKSPHSRVPVVEHELQLPPPDKRNAEHGKQRQRDRGGKRI